MTVSLLFLVFAAVLFALAGFNVPSDGRVRFEWLGAACVTIAIIAGGLVLS